MMSSLPTSGFWQSSGLAPPPLRFCLPARQQVSHLAEAGGTVSPFVTGDPHARHSGGGRKKGFISRVFRGAEPRRCMLAAHGGA